jgi:hypothetical protein
MAFVPVPKAVEVNLNFLMLGQLMQNGLYFAKSGLDTWTEADMTALAGDIVDWWQAGLALQLTTALSLQNVTVTDLKSATAASITYTTGLPDTGVGTDDPLPTNVAMCVSFRTAGRGRSSRGRNYVVGFGDQQANGNVFGSTLGTSVTSAYSDLFTIASNNNCDWVVVSRVSEGVEREFGLVQPVVAATLVDLFVDSQRRRLPGRGR